MKTKFVVSLKKPGTEPVVLRRFVMEADAPRLTDRDGRQDIVLLDGVDGWESGCNVLTTVWDVLLMLSKDGMWQQVSLTVEDEDRPNTTDEFESLSQRLIQAGWKVEQPTPADSKEGV